MVMLHYLNALHQMLKAPAESNFCDKSALTALGPPGFMVDTLSP